MCGRYVTPSESELERAYELGRRNWRFEAPRYNVGPTLSVPLIRLEGAVLVGAQARWGLIPAWWRAAAAPSLSFNARSEEAAEKPMWRNGLRSARGIMPAKGWYEWNEQERVKTVTGRLANQPYFLHVPGQPVVSIASLWSEWEDPSGQTLLSCALLTREAEGPAAQVHHRMPIVLSADQTNEWLSPTASLDQVQQIMRGSRTDIEAYPVSTAVNSSRYEGEQCLHRVDPVPANAPTPEPQTRNLF